MAADKVRLAAIGLGWWGGMLAEAVKRSGEGEIYTCFARSADARKAYAEKVGCRQAGSFEEVLKDPAVQGLVLATPHSTHVPLIEQAASAGKHVFVEKPLALTVKDARRAIAACEKAKVTLLVGHHRRRQGANRRIKEMIGKGELGMVHQLEANLSLFGGQTPRPGWRSDPAESPAGAMTGLGVHMIDNLIYLAGPVKRVAAFSKPLLGKSRLDDVTSLILEFEGGPLGYIGSTYVIPKLCYTRAYGTEASAYSDQEGGKLYFQKKGEDVPTEIPVQGGDALALELAELANCIRGKVKPETDGHASLQVVAVLEGVIESARTGRAVDVAALRAG